MAHNFEIQFEIGSYFEIRNGKIIFNVGFIKIIIYYNRSLIKCSFPQHVSSPNATLQPYRTFIGYCLVDDIIFSHFAQVRT